MKWLKRSKTTPQKKARQEIKAGLRWLKKQTGFFCRRKFNVILLVGEPGQGKSDCLKSGITRFDQQYQSNTLNIIIKKNQIRMSLSGRYSIQAQFDKLINKINHWRRNKGIDHIIYCVDYQNIKTAPEWLPEITEYPYYLLISNAPCDEKLGELEQNFLSMIKADNIAESLDRLEITQKTSNQSSSWTCSKATSPWRGVFLTRKNSPRFYDCLIFIHKPYWTAKKFIMSNIIFSSLIIFYTLTQYNYLSQYQQLSKPRQLMNINDFQALNKLLSGPKSLLPHTQLKAKIKTTLQPWLEAVFWRPLAFWSHQNLSGSLGQVSALIDLNDYIQRPNTSHKHALSQLISTAWTQLNQSDLWPWQISPIIEKIIPENKTHPLAVISKHKLKIARQSVKKYTQFQRSRAQVDYLSQHYHPPVTYNTDHWQSENATPWMYTSEGRQDFLTPQLQRHPILAGYYMHRDKIYLKSWDSLAEGIAVLDQLIPPIIENNLALKTQYKFWCKKLKQDLLTWQAEDNPRQAAWTIIKNSLNKQKTPLEQRYQELADLTKNLDDTTKSQLFEPIKQTWHILTKLTQRYLNQQWQREVHQYYQQNLAKTYPFQASRTTARPAAVQSLLNSSHGKLWQFEKNYLNFIKNKTWHGHKIIIDQKFWRNLKQWRQCSPYLTGDVRDKLLIKPTPNPKLTELKLKLGDEIYLYRNGPVEWTPLIMPNLTEPTVIQLTVRGTEKKLSLNLDTRDIWGLIKLCDHARLEILPNTDIQVTWTPSTQLTLKSQNHPEVLGWLLKHRLHLPAVIV